MKKAATNQSSGDHDVIALRSFSRWTSQSYKVANSLLRQGKIEEVEPGTFRETDKRFFRMPNPSLRCQEIVSLLEKEYPAIDFIAYDASFLNEFLNQLVSTHAVFLETDRHFVPNFHYALTDGGFQSVLVSPGKKEFDKYFERDSIVLLPLITRSPIDQKRHEPKLEKIIVDLFAGGALTWWWSPSELPDILQSIFTSYVIDYPTLNAYLNRRGLKERFYSFLKQEKMKGWCPFDSNGNFLFEN